MRLMRLRSVVSRQILETHDSESEILLGQLVEVLVGSNQRQIVRQGHCRDPDVIFCDLQCFGRSIIAPALWVHTLEFALRCLTRRDLPSPFGAQPSLFNGNMSSHLQRL